MQTITNLPGHIKSINSICKLLAFVFIYCVGAKTVNSQNLPAGFSQVQVANNITSPVTMSFAPDGRLFILQKDGALRVFKNGSLLSQPFISLNVNTGGERGLLGIAFDPSFSTNHYIYLYYTLASGSNNRISRFTANGDVAIPGSEKVILNLDALSSANNHNGGNMLFGPDGKLYIGVGDNDNSANSQNLNTYLGKILRIKKDGSVPPGNPFTSGSAQKRRVWSYGMRNPFTMSLQPGTGKIFVNDVGASDWEEINDATVGGKNYGWPAQEGAGTSPGLTNPVYTYEHDAPSNGGCAITGGTFFNPASTSYPSQYNGSYFFIDYCGAWIDRLTFSGSTATRTGFATNIAGGSVGITTGPDGNLYFLSRNNEALYKITYTSSSSPVITGQPQNLKKAQGKSATFSVSATGASPLSFQWKKNGSNISGATGSSYTISSVASSDAGTYTVKVSNSSGSVTSNDATLTVTAANSAPAASITSPAAGTTYKAGNTISFSGSGSDAEDGTLPASTFEWFIVFHHDNHTHPGPAAPSGVTSGSFTIPDMGEISSNVYYRLFLVVRDSQGEPDTAYVDILPRTTTITLSTNPQGLHVTFDGQPQTAPYSYTTVEGMKIAIGAVSPQTNASGITYAFTGWAGGGNKTHTIKTPVSNITYTANFTTQLRPADNPSNIISGLTYAYYKGTWNSLPDFDSKTPAATGTVQNFDLSPRTRDDDFGFRFTGYVEVPSDGIYTFYTSSDDGSRLYIGNTLIVDNDGSHSLQEASGNIGLKAGKHQVTVNYFENAGSQALIVSYAGGGISKQAIPDSALFTPSDNITLNPVADSYVRSGTYSNNNYGSSIHLLSKRDPDGNSNEKIYLKFDISTLGSNVSSARLRVYGNIYSNPRTSTTVRAQAVSNVSWSENAINFNNKPKPQAGALDETTVAGNTNKYYDWDVTDYINNRLSAGSNLVTLFLTNPNITPNCKVRFNSREASKHRPQLKIVSGSPKLSESGNIQPGNEQLKIYPNPANNEFTIEISGDRKGDAIKLYDLNGKIYRDISIDGNPLHTISTDNLNNGIYIVTVEENNKAVLRKKVVIQK